MTTNNTFSNQKREENNTFCNLTEQWKKGELEQGWYYVLLFSNEEYITFIDGNWVVDDRLVGADIKQVLAPVPSWEQWQSLNEIIDSMNDTNKALAHRLNMLKELLKECGEWIEFMEEKQKLKKLLKECRNLINECITGDYVKELCERIDEVLK